MDNVDGVDGVDGVDECKTWTNTDKVRQQTAS